jgi:hypothetical protein
LQAGNGTLEMDAFLIAASDGFCCKFLCEFRGGFGGGFCASLGGVNMGVKMATGAVAGVHGQKPKRFT